jgi:hypothetical protein
MTRKSISAARAAGRALAAFSVASRMQNKTPEERSEQGRKAVAARWAKARRKK